jgi:hypothetical protein
LQLKVSLPNLPMVLSPNPAEGHLPDPY